MSYIELKKVKKEYIMGEVKITAAHNVSFAICSFIIRNVNDLIFVENL